ncbi:hypothetical protein TOTORO_01690 [Serratia phage vB_SmaS-Totoro]|nr:hypothetical protein TOTORO_01690 [Serratia phage vB_SmaS-Totoro]
MDSLEVFSQVKVRRLIRVGFWFGYSNQSIFEFVIRVFTLTTQEKREIIPIIEEHGWDRYGYIPTSEELKRPVEEVLQEINSRRICKTPMTKDIGSRSILAGNKPKADLITEEMSKRWLDLLAMFVGTPYEEAVTNKRFVLEFSLGNKED